MKNKIKTFLNTLLFCTIYPALTYYGIFQNVSGAKNLLIFFCIVSAIPNILATIGLSSFSLQQKADLYEKTSNLADNIRIIVWIALTGVFIWHGQLILSICALVTLCCMMIVTNDLSNAFKTRNKENES